MKIGFLRENEKEKYENNVSMKNLKEIKSHIYFSIKSEREENPSKRKIICNNHEVFTNIEVHGESRPCPIESPITVAFTLKISPI